MAASDSQVILARKQYREAYDAWDEVFEYGADSHYTDAWFNRSLKKFVRSSVLLFRDLYLMCYRPTGSST